MKWKMSWNGKCCDMPIVMKCQMSWNVKCHEMSNVMKCQISWKPDAGSMTPSRNTRRYTLRSVQSSPGRSFLFSPHYWFTLLIIFESVGIWCLLFPVVHPGLNVIWTLSERFRDWSLFGENTFLILPERRLLKTGSIWPRLIFVLFQQLWTAEYI